MTHNLGGLEQKEESSAVGFGCYVVTFLVFRLVEGSGLLDEYSSKVFNGHKDVSHK